VAVFGASNFPLAFSVAGGDTASALAAGCPVVVKAHPAHPGTSELVGRAIQKAVAACGLPEGTFSLLFDAGQSIGQGLVADPRIAAVGFTGSRRGGTALMAIAAGRPSPIPVYAEMSSINPVLLFPGALAARGAAIGKAFAASLTLGAGQFCTNPGLILALPGPGLDAFLEAAGAALRESPAATMLTPGIQRAYREAVARVAGHAAVTRIAEGAEGGATQGRATLFAADFGRVPGGSRAAGGDVRRLGARGALRGLRRDAGGSGASGGPAHRLAAPRAGGSRGRARPAAAPGAPRRPDPGGRVRDRRRGGARHGAWRPLSGDLGRAHDLGGQSRDRPIPCGR
jgi:hypothetical protein